VELNAFTAAVAMGLALWAGKMGQYDNLLDGNPMDGELVTSYHRRKNLFQLF
jgi:hypothetical protein